MSKLKFKLIIDLFDIFKGIQVKISSNNSLSNRKSYEISDIFKQRILLFLNSTNEEKIYMKLNFKF
ncbi:hypothetical protein BpHYR1_010020 [Brachionus plicatilis]|uniref:Uncharacterized protein n=1 Tax=Brachionus plicatilis TaxID=10195 RepID=A0A3M7QFS5_BRAPC|nr:hypothetical protein BpHYR1_010020 [Brachionus plicatilis]